MNKQVYRDLETLSFELAEWITGLIEEKLLIQPRFCIALSGGNTPKRLHELLATSPFRDRIDWKKIHVFFGDERVVPLDDKRNNARMALDTLLNKVDIPANQIHIMQTEIGPERGAAQYESLLRQYFGGNETGFPETSFDLILLGMGDDGHTLSLFPGTPVLQEEKKWVDSFFLPAQEMTRITITKNIANRANYIVFMISGDAKAHAVHEVLQGKYDPARYPSQLIEPLHGELHFFMDEAAAAEL